MPRLFHLILCGFLATSLHSHAQEKDSWGFDLAIGGAYPLNKKTNNTFHLGINFILAGNLPALQFQKLNVKPAIGMKWYYKEIQEVNQVTEHLRTWKAGLQVEYDVVKLKTLQLSPIIKLDYNWTSNYFSETYYYDPWTNTSTTATTSKYLKGTGISCDVGLKGKFRQFFIQFNYEYYKPELNVHPDIISNAMNEGIIIAPRHRYNFNSLNLAAGISVNF